MALIEINNVKKYFTLKKSILGQPKDVIKAVDGVNLLVNSKENVGIVGESGSGKTTLARMIMRLYAPDSGTVLFEGNNIHKLRGKKLRAFRQGCQMIFQDPYSSLDPRWSIRHILDEAFELDKIKYKTRGLKDERIKDILPLVGLKEDILRRYPHEFSGGERQRIAILRALLVGPRLLILDEAVSSLDRIVQEQIIELLKKLQNELDLTYLFITHNLRAVRKISHRIVVMYQGKIVESAKTEDIFKNPIHPYTQQLLAAAITYRLPDGETVIYLPSNGKLVEREQEHFVLQ
jgi:oligopeptide transport system ATP-binding protein